MSLRYRLWVSFALLLALLAVLGVGFIHSLGVVSDRIDGILRENYRSVDAMTGLTEAAGRIDSAFVRTLAGLTGGRGQFDAHWAVYRHHLDVERNNITEPGEAELVARLAALSDRYRAAGEQFFAPGRVPAERAADYGSSDGRPGPLLDTFRQVKEVTGAIRRLNQDGMEAASRQARDAAGGARWWASGGLLAALAATGLLGWRTGLAILRPVEDLTRSAQAVGDGRFDLPVTATTRDEIGGLVAAFYRMTAQLRDLRESQAARLLRAQQASQATPDAFPDPVLVIDPAGRVDMANPAARRVLGVTPGAGPAGSRRTDCGGRWPLPSASNTRCCPGRSARRWCTAPGARSGRSSPRCCRSATRTAAPWGRPWCSTTSPGSACWTSSRPTWWPPPATS